MPSRQNKGALKDDYKHCKVCGWQVERPCSSAGEVRRCKKQQQNKALAGLSADVVRAVSSHGKKVKYEAVPDAEFNALVR